MIGGMITERTVKYTRQNQQMAFLTVEDLLGTVEVVVFPRDYAKYQELLQEEAKVFIRGRVNAEEEKNGKVICEKVYPFDAAKQELWLQFQDREAFDAEENRLYGLLNDSDGNDPVVIYLSGEKAMKRLPESRSVHIDTELVQKLEKVYGQGNVRVVEKAIERDKG